MGVPRPACFHVAAGRPDIEYLLCEHTVDSTRTGSKLMQFGHAAIRYNLAGKDTVVNVSCCRCSLCWRDAPDCYCPVSQICGVPGRPMVHFMDAKMYLAGTKNFTSGACEQGGMYNRNFCGLRLERVPSGTVEALHAFYKALQAGENAGLRRFDIRGGKVGNTLKTMLPFFEETAQVGNCAYVRGV